MKKTTRRRVVFSMVLVLLFLGVFVVRLVDIQVVRAASLNEDAMGKRSQPTVVYGTRGQIVDAKGSVLADAVMKYNVTVSPKNAKDFTREGDRGDIKVTAQQAATEIAEKTGQTPDEVIGIINDALVADPESDFAYIKKGIDVETFRALDRLDIPWLYFEQDPARTYSNGAVAGNLLGFVGSDGVPLAGLELSEDSCLAAINGEETYERGADGVRIPGSTVTTKEAKNGGTLKLTINSDLQWYTQQILAKQVAAQGGQWGIAVVMEAKTGKLVAVADYPSVDPNNVAATAEQFRGSQAFSAPYEPGSTMKIMTAGMLLDQGLADPTTQVYSPTRITYPNGASFKDSGGHNPRLTFTGILVESSNVGISQLADAMSPETRYDYLRKFGFGETTNVNFLAESAGIMYPADEWDNQTHYTTMFGQGMTATAIQMASAYSAVANGGTRMPVSLVESCTSADGQVQDVASSKGKKVISAAAARTDLDMMENIVTKGWLSRDLTIPGYRLAAKTGTAQQSNGDGTYSDRYIVTIAGIVPADDPQFIVLTTIANPALNSTKAVAPVWHDLSAQVIKEYRIQPSTSGTPDLPAYY